MTITSAIRSRVEGPALRRMACVCALVSLVLAALVAGAGGASAAAPKAPTVTPGRPAMGAKVVVQGRLLPRARRPVQVQRSHDGRWTTIARGRTSATGLYRLRVVAAPTASTYRFRVVANAGRFRVGNRVKRLSRLVSRSRVVTVVNPDRAVLMSLYNATDGKHWSEARGWGTTRYICAWYGVSCNSSGHVTKLELSLNQLRGRIPAALDQLRSLQDLRLNDNGLSGSIPPQLGQAPALKNLDLGYNDLTGTIPASLGGLAHLTSLSLAANDLFGPIPTGFGRLVGLRLLALEENELTGSIPTSMGGLHSLDLSFNDFTGPVPSELSQLGELVNLDLRHNQLTGAIPPELARLSNLLFLDLSHNGLGGPIPTDLDGLYLDSLGLESNCGLTATDPDLLGWLNALDPLWATTSPTCP